MKSIRSDVCSPFGATAERACSRGPVVPRVELDVPLSGRMNFFERSVASDVRRLAEEAVFGLLGLSAPLAGVGGPLDLMTLAKSRVESAAGFASRAMFAFVLGDETPALAPPMG